MRRIYKQNYFSVCRFSLILIACLLKLSSPSLAAPTISGVSGTLTQGSQITISGLDFLSWSPADILAWDDFEGTAPGNYTPGSEIPTSPKIGSWHKWTPSGTTYIISALIDTTYKVSGGQSMWGHRGLADSWSGASVNIGELQNLYVSFWFRFNRQGTGNVKLMEVKGTQIGSCPGYEPQIATAGMTVSDTQNDWSTYVALDEPHGAYDGGCRSTNSDSLAYPTTPVANSWHFFEAIMIQSSPDVSNGLVEIRIDGVRESYASGVLTRVLPASRWVEVQMLNGMTNFPASNTWVDDMYVSKNLSRVLLCNASTYQASTACHLQVPLTWTSNSVTARVNKGAFASGQQAYLYLVNSGNNVNANGYQVSIGGNGEIDVLPPAAPGNLQTAG